MRNYLQNKGFYEDQYEDTDEVQSKMYVDSEEDKFEYEPVSSVKKQQPPKQLMASPLRGVKNDTEKGNVFYKEDEEGHEEKVIIYSIINSSRPDGENAPESLSNTQQYVPLRLKKTTLSPPALSTNQNTVVKAPLVEQDLVPKRLQQLIPCLDLGKLPCQ